MTLWTTAKFEEGRALEMGPPLTMTYKRKATMRLYMLRDNRTGLYFKRGGTAWKARWVVQKEGSVWTSMNGPNAAKRYAKDHTVVVLEAKEVEPC